MNNLKNAVIYGRVSTKEQAKSGESLGNQEDKCRGFADNNGFNVVDVFMEKGKTGRHTNRPELKDMLDRCYDKKNAINAVIMYKRDRFTRNTKDYIDLYKKLKTMDIELLFTNGINLDTSIGRFVAREEASIAELESDMISDRICDGNRKVRKNGRYPYKKKGYDIGVNTDKKKQIYPNNEAKYVKECFELYDNGYNQQQIIKSMARKGFKISSQMLSDMLRDIVYCGWLPDIHNENNGEPIKAIHEPLNYRRIICFCSEKT